MSHTVNRLDGDIVALTPWALLHIKSKILLPEGIWNCTSSSQFSPRHPCSPLAAEYLISWSISIINLSNRNNHHKITRSALIISIALLKSIKSIRSTLICARWEFYPASRQNKGNTLLSGHAYDDCLYLEVHIWIEKIITSYSLAMSFVRTCCGKGIFCYMRLKNLLLKSALKWEGIFLMIRKHGLKSLGIYNRIYNSSPPPR